jgi:Uma2 family endonuclease
MTTTAERLYTVEEFERLPAPREGGKVELVDGRLIMMSPVGKRHGLLAVRIASALEVFVDEHSLGSVGVEIGFHLPLESLRVRAPDVCFIAGEPEAYDETDDGFVRGAPTLAVEVISPEDRDAQMSAKVDEYLRAGTSRVWVVRPSLKSVQVYSPGGDSHVFGVEDSLTSGEAGFAVPDFELPLKQLFR